MFSFQVGMVVVVQARETTQPHVAKEAVLPKYRRQTSNVLANQGCSVSTETIDGEANARFAEYECQKHHHGAIDRGTEAMERALPHSSNAQVAESLR